MDIDIFSESEWHKKCDQIQNELAYLSPIPYVDSFSSKIDSLIELLPENNRYLAISIALSFGYTSEADREEMHKWNDENGYCTHGLDYSYCPAGCGHY